MEVKSDLRRNNKPSNWLLEAIIFPLLLSAWAVNTATSSVSLLRYNTVQ